MVSLHKVREYVKKSGSDVREHLRGAGTKAKEAGGKFEGFAKQRATEAGDQAKEKIQQKLEERQAERNIRSAARAEAQARQSEMDKAERLDRIEREEAARAKSGGFLKHGISQLKGIAEKELRKQQHSGGRSTGRRRAAPARRGSSARRKHRSGETHIHIHTH